MSAAIDDLAILPATDQPYDIHYQDDVLLVVSKPSHLLTVPGRHPANRDCLISRVQREFPTAQVVHRLDYDTSGLVILPLTKKALSEISKQFQARTVEKTYQAVVAGQIAESGTIDLAIAADPEHRPLYKICQQTGKPSVTRFQRLHYNAQQDNSAVLLQPITGRSHQLRLHLAAIGHPILGDTFYGGDLVAKARPRLLLHARQIRFNHPLNGKRLQIELAPDFAD